MTDWHRKLVWHGIRYRPLADIADEGQSADMPIPQILFATVLSWSALPIQHQRQNTGFYGASVTFRDGECWFWTGDVGLTASQFERDLKDRFKPKGEIIISYAQNTPARCVKMARRSAIQAGFMTVKVAVNPDADPIGPPSNGS